MMLIDPFGMKEVSLSEDKLLTQGHESLCTEKKQNLGPKSKGPDLFHEICYLDRRVDSIPLAPLGREILNE